MIQLNFVYYIISNYLGTLQEIGCLPTSIQCIFLRLCDSKSRFTSSVDRICRKLQLDNFFIQTGRSHIYKEQNTLKITPTKFKSYKKAKICSQHNMCLRIRFRRYLCLNFLLKYKKCTMILTQAQIFSGIAFLFLQQKPNHFERNRFI